MMKLYIKLLFMVTLLVPMKALTAHADEHAVFYDGNYMVRTLLISNNKQNMQYRLDELYEEALVKAKQIYDAAFRRFGIDFVIESEIMIEDICGADEDCGKNKEYNVIDKQRYLDTARFYLKYVRCRANDARVNPDIECNDVNATANDLFASFNDSINKIHSEYYNSEYQLSSVPNDISFIENVYAAKDYTLILTDNMLLRYDLASIANPPDSYWQGKSIVSDVFMSSNVFGYTSIVSLYPLIKAYQANNDNGNIQSNSKELLINELAHAIAKTLAKTLNSMDAIYYIECKEPIKKDQVRMKALYQINGEAACAILSRSARYSHMKYEMLFNNGIYENALALLYIILETDYYDYGNKDDLIIDFIRTYNALGRETEVSYYCRKLNKTKLRIEEGFMKYKSKEYKQAKEICKNDYDRTFYFDDQCCSFK
ncbi:MAG: hypothetical protein BWY28_02404 [bacterium ADurb.Bin236]|nr:MAG: hypothetical protein BWY28_02404 [bacterium ADurb.Bin236]HPN95176.1 hypothetical protein [bacterium]